MNLGAFVYHSMFDIPKVPVKNNRRRLAPIAASILAEILRKAGPNTNWNRNVVLLKNKRYFVTNFARRTLTHVWILN